MDKKDVEVGDVVKFRIFGRAYLSREITVEALSEEYAQGRKADGVQMYARYDEIFEVKKQPKKTIYTHTCDHYPLVQPTTEETRIYVMGSLCPPCRETQMHDTAFDQVIEQLEGLRKQWHRLQEERK